VLTGGRFVAGFGSIVVLAALGAAAEPALGTPDSALTRLFTPISAPRGRYVVYRSERPVADIARGLRALDLTPAPGAWEPNRPEGHDAFGQEGSYDRSRLARLFRGQRVTLIRGSLVKDDRRVAYTLISPFPDASLRHIEPGTMIIEFNVPPLAHEGTEVSGHSGHQATSSR
jgi:hypothetical protein